MYESPIEMIVSKMQQERQNLVYKAVQNVGIYVDKEKLEKALNYDRNQYECGFEDGKKDGIEECLDAIELCDTAAECREILQILKGGG